MTHVVVLHSGGLDSTTLLYAMVAEFGVEQVHALSVHYGQRHAVELQHAAQQCAALGVARTEVNLQALLPVLAGSSQTDPSVPVPLGHYADETMKVTVVPNRNMILLAVAAACAISRAGDADWAMVAYAAHGGDHAIYPDCRPAFVDQVRQALAVCDWKRVALLAPYLEQTKGDVVRHAVRLGVPLETTWSCYQGGAVHCGACGTCVERREAFVQAGVADPTAYAAPLVE